MKVAVVNVGTIGHVDHGHTTLTAALARLGHEVLSLTWEDVQRDTERVDLALGPAEFSPYCEPEHGRAKDPQRKADRKARLRAAQLRAFEGRR